MLWASHLAIRSTPMRTLLTMRKRYLLKRLTREIRDELLMYSRDDLESLAEMHILFKDDAPMEPRLVYMLRKKLAKQLIAHDGALRSQGADTGKPWSSTELTASSKVHRHASLNKLA